MWNRPLAQRLGRGHVDFPRLADAGVALQCFTIVTDGFPIVGGFAAFARWRRWPRAARRSPWTRCRFQIELLEEACAASGGRAAIATDAAGLDANLAAGRLSAVLGVEGGQALEGRVERVEALHRAGVRFMSLTHLRGNALGGTSSPGLARARQGLTSLGREVVAEMVRVGMSVDVSHASPRLLEDLLAVPGVRLMCSHTGVRGVTRSFRNLDDDVLREIARRGGVAGIILAPIYLGARGLDAVARHVEHALAVMGEACVGLGSDHDGMVALPRGMRDVRDLPRLAVLLRERGLPEPVVRGVMGENWIRFFRESL